MKRGVVSGRFSALGIALALILGGYRGTAAEAQGRLEGEGGTKVQTVHAFAAKRIDGKDVALADYEGNVLLIVNVASKCGFTGQYKGLQELYETYKDRGLVILGFPANNFPSIRFAAKA
jgi:hypothetical protein